MLTLRQEWDLLLRVVRSYCKVWRAHSKISSQPLQCLPAAPGRTRSLHALFSGSAVPRGAPVPGSAGGRF